MVVVLRSARLAVLQKLDCGRAVAVWIREWSRL